MKNYLWLVLALTLSACSSGSTNSSFGVNLAGNWRGVMSTSGGTPISQRFRMTLRDKVIEGEDDDVTVFFDGTIAFADPRLECLTGGGILAASRAGSRIAFQVTDRNQPPFIIVDFTGNSSNSRMEGTWTMVQSNIEIQNPDDEVGGVIEVGGPCNLIGGQWVANRI